MNAQRIIVDTTSSSKYLIKKPTVEKEPTQAEAQEPSFGDRALSIGSGILNRLKARLNLEDAAESIKEKKDRLVGSKEEEENDDG